MREKWAMQHGATSLNGIDTQEQERAPPWSKEAVASPTGDRGLKYGDYDVAEAVAEAARLVEQRGSEISASPCAR